jgi:hypothetical protein
VLGDRPEVGFGRRLGLPARRGPSRRLRLGERGARPHDVARGDHLGLGGHPQERVARRPTERQHERVAREGTAALGREHRDRRHLPRAACLEHPAADEGDGGARGSERLGQVRTLLGVGDDDDALADRHAVDRGHPGGAAAEPDAGQVVAREHAVRLERARRDDHVLRLDLDQLVGPEQRGGGALVDPDRGVLLEDLGAGGARLGGQTRDRVARRRIGGPSAERRFVGEQDGAIGRRRRRRGQPRDPAADHQRSDPHEPCRGPARGSFPRQRSRAGRPADHPLRDRPQPARTSEHLVVEADGHEPVEPVVDRERVAFRGRPPGLPLDAHPIVRRRHACALARQPVDGHEAVRAVAGGAVQTAPPVCLQRPGEGSDARAEGGRCDRVAVADLDAPPVQSQRRHRSGLDAVRAGVARQRHPPRQPSRWNQRSCCGPAALSCR